MKTMDYYYQVDALSNELFGDGRMLHLVEPHPLEDEDDDTRGMFRGLDKLTLTRLGWPCIPHPFTDDQFRKYWQARWAAAEQRREENNRCDAFAEGVADAALRAAGVDPDDAAQAFADVGAGDAVSDADLWEAQLRARVLNAATAYWIKARVGLIQ